MSERVGYFPSSLHVWPGVACPLFYTGGGGELNLLELILKRVT